MKKESVVAVVPETELNEQELTQQVTDIEFQAESFIIQTDDDYAAAGEFGKLLKQKAAEVTTFFKPMNRYFHKSRLERRIEEARREVEGSCSE